jgi:hypothetical protein
VTRYGPAPTGAMSRPSPNAVGLTMIPARLDRMPGRAEFGAASTRTAVVGSTTCTSVMLLRSATTAEPSTVWPRSMLAFTAAASNDVPSWNSTPERSFSVSCNPSSENSHDSARPGMSVPVES